MLAVALLLGGVAFAPAARAQGRPLTVGGQQGLTIGSVIPGIPTVVPFTDAARAATFDVRARAGSQVEFRFTLPTALTGPGGAAMPLLFGSASAGYSTSGNAAGASPRDPNVPFTVVITSNNGRAYLYLGGTAMPTGTQPPGAYTGTVLLTAAYTGL